RRMVALTPRRGRRLLDPGQRPVRHEHAARVVWALGVGPTRLPDEAGDAPVELVRLLGGEVEVPATYERGAAPFGIEVRLREDEAAKGFLVARGDVGPNLGLDCASFGIVRLEGDQEEVFAPPPHALPAVAAV